MASGFDHDARLKQGGNFLAQRLGAAQIGDGDLGAATAQEERRGKAGLAEPNDQYFFALQFHPAIHLNFNAVSAW